MKYTSWLFILCALLLSSCKKEVVPYNDAAMGKDYFPLSIGHFVEYDVDSFYFNDFAKRVDTFHYELKDVVESEFTDNAGRKSFLIHRYKRQDTSYSWSEHHTYYCVENAYNIEVVEDNLRFIKMVFPVKVNTRWDGNVYLPANLITEYKWLSGWEYKYVNINEPFNTGFLNFENTVTINHVDVVVGDSLDMGNYSERTFSRERYAKNAGLITREVVYWDYQSETTKYRKGFMIIYRAKNYN